MTNSSGSKVTLSTIKSFIKRELKANNLYIQNKSDFDGMIDGIRQLEGGFRKTTATKEITVNNQGVEGAWFVGSSRDHFLPFADENYIGYKIGNCCGSFILAFHR